MSQCDVQWLTKCIWIMYNFKHVWCIDIRCCLVRTKLFWLILLIVSELSMNEWLDNQCLQNSGVESCWSYIWHVLVDLLYNLKNVCLKLKMLVQEGGQVHFGSFREKGQKHDLFVYLFFIFFVDEWLLFTHLTTLFCHQTCTKGAADTLKQVVTITQFSWFCDLTTFLH
jgi:hypothetical protein